VSNVVRVISGTYRGRILKSPPSMQVRPTSDRLKETLFNVISPRIEEARFLDLCAGSGAIGIEAISRGASFATFVDKSRKMCGLIEANLDLCQVPEEMTEVVLSEAADYLKRILKEDKERWDIAFFDPPYSSDYLSVLRMFGTNTNEYLSAEGILIVEHHHKNELPDDLGQMRRWRILKQGDSVLSFYER
jgi:16S rRNA (guanine966-N2)-methyltransferase